MAEVLQKAQVYVMSQMADHGMKRGAERRQGEPFVTISRQTGACGLTIAEALAQYLQKHERRKNCVWTALDKNLIQKVIEEHGFPESYDSYFGESRFSEIQDSIEEIFGLHPSRWTLVHRMGATIFRLAQRGYVILVGRGGNFITRGLPKGVHIRLIGSAEKRLRNIEEFHGLSKKQARRFMEKEEKERAAYVRKYFNCDVNDPAFYDMVINMDALSVDKVVMVIADLVLGGRKG